MPLKVWKNLERSEEKENNLLTKTKMHEEYLYKTESKTNWFSEKKSRQLLRVFLENVFCSLDHVTDPENKKKLTSSIDTGKNTTSKMVYHMRYYLCDTAKFSTT